MVYEMGMSGGGGPCHPPSQIIGIISYHKLMLPSFALSSAKLPSSSVSLWLKRECY